MALPPPLIPSRPPSAGAGSASAPAAPLPPGLPFRSRPRPPAAPGLLDDDDFGAFVSVPEGQDPLGASNDLLSFSPPRPSTCTSSGPPAPATQLVDELLHEDLVIATHSAPRTVPSGPAFDFHRPPASAHGHGHPVLSPPRRFSQIMGGPSSSSAQRSNSHEVPPASSPVEAHPSLSLSSHHPSDFFPHPSRAPPDPWSTILNSAEPESIVPPPSHPPPPPPRHHVAAIASLPITLKATSKWTSLLSSSSSSSSSAPPPATISHTSPFQRPLSSSFDSLSSSFSPPTGAPGFRPDSGWNTGGWELPSQGEDMAEVRLVGRRDESTVPVLSASTAELLRPHLPPRARLAPSWDLIFSLDQHGASLATLYHLADKYADRRPGAGNLLVVRDADGHVFGGFVNEAFKVKPGSYYGNGECFLYRLHTFPNSTADRAVSGGIEVFKWTGRNDYMVLSESTFLSLGGGDGRYGLFLDQALYSGSSARSPAFDNEVLCSSSRAGAGGVGRERERETRFECLGVEVWAVGG